MDDSELLREYATERSEAAFASLVERHIHFVYSSALRQVGNAHLAEEVTQAVFIILARKAGRLRQGTVLAGWFFNTARFVAAAELRAAARRQKHEQEAGMASLLRETTTDASWEQIAPFLDEGLAQLSEKDRQAVLLRFIEEKTFLEVGAHLGANEDAARMRVARALKSLRGFFLKRGLTLSVAALTTVLSANAVQAAPASLVAAVTASAALHGAATSTSTAALVKGASNLMLMTKTKIVISAALLVGIVSTPVLIQQQALATARAEQSQLQTQLRDLPAQNVTTTRQPGTIDMAARDRADLERLRIEAAALRAKIAAFSAQAQQLAAASVWHKTGGTPLSEILRPRDLRDVGQATPEATMQSFLSAMLQGDANRINQLLVVDGAGDDSSRAGDDSSLQKALEKILKTFADLQSDPRAPDMDKMEVYLLEEQAATNNDRWVVAESLLDGTFAGATRVLLRPTDTGWRCVINTNGDTVEQQIKIQP